MASSPSSSVLEVKKHEIFLSFRGADTRDNFTSHLDGALGRSGIPTFIDYRLERGEEIEPAILQAIADSNVSVIVLSRNFANSPWCLDELVEILRCKDQQGQKVIPVFYHVDPTDVGNQTGSYGEALAKLEQDFSHNLDRVQNWRRALTRAANLSGEVFPNGRTEFQLVEDIANNILKFMKHSSSNHQHRNLVGLTSRIKKIEELLCVGLDDEVRMVGIWGMGGIGKTTLATQVSEKIAAYFEGSCFIEKVREKTNLEKELLGQIFGNGNANCSRPMFRLQQLRYKKILIVLDDVDNYRQIEFLESICLRKGSRVIITSRDRKVFRHSGHGIYICEVPGLVHHEALQLFSLCAFEQLHPKGDHVVLSSNVVSYAGGNPLALKILGLFLHGKSKEEWESAVEKLGRSPPYMRIQNALKISYDGLELEELQETFLHISCFFVGEPVSHVERLLSACGISALTALKELDDKSLITILDNSVKVHDLLKEMGREIVRQECIKEPAKRSRLWNPEDIRNALTKNKGTEAIEGIFLDKSKLNNNLRLEPTVFSSMNNLKLLKFHYSANDVENIRYFDDFKSVRNDWHFPKGLVSLPEELRYLQWNFYPLKRLPSNYNAEKLVELNMSGSSVIRLWNGVQNLANLKVIILRHCRKLVEMPNLWRAQNLEVVDLGGCISLVRVCESVGCLQKLNELILQGCENIDSLPNTKSSALRRLDLSCCSKIKKFPEIPTSVQHLIMRFTPIEEIPSAIRLLCQLKELNLLGCFHLERLPDAVFQLEHLEVLLISGPYVHPSELVNNLRSLSSLTVLRLTSKILETLPSSLTQLLGLRMLYLRFSTRLQTLPQLPPSLLVVDLSHCISLEAVSNSMTALPQGWGYFSFSNCIALSRQERGNILKYARRRIFHLAHATPEQRQEFDSFTAPSRERFIIILPGNTIPKWIQDQRVGNSVTIPLPPQWYHNFLGFVLSAIFELGKTSFCRVVEVKCEFKSDYGEGYCISETFDYWEWERVPSKDQVFLSYFNNFFPPFSDRGNNMCSYNELLLQFFTQDFYGNPLPYSKVKNCGAQLLYRNPPGDDDDDDDCYSADGSTEALCCAQEERGSHDQSIRTYNTSPKALRFFSRCFGA